MGDVLVSLMVGIMGARGFYCLFNTQLVRKLLGIGLLGNAINLMIFSSGEWQDGGFPIQEAEKSLQDVSDPLPQALVSTAIVIGLAIIAFSIALVSNLSSQSKIVDERDFE